MAYLLWRVGSTQSAAKLSSVTSRPCKHVDTFSELSGLCELLEPCLQLFPASHGLNTCSIKALAATPDACGCCLALASQPIQTESSKKFPWTALPDFRQTRSWPLTINGLCHGVQAGCLPVTVGVRWHLPHRPPLHLRANPNPPVGQRIRCNLHVLPLHTPMMLSLLRKEPFRRN